MVEARRPRVHWRVTVRRLVTLPWTVAGYYRVWRMCGNSRRTAIRYAASFGRKSLTSRAIDGQSASIGDSTPHTSGPSESPRMAISDQTSPAEVPCE